MPLSELSLTEIFELIDQRVRAKRALREQQWPKRSKGPRVRCRGLTKRTREPCKALSEPGTKRCRWHTPRGARVICGARRRRDGLPCQARSVKGKTRCRWHGGASTGPRTREGQLKSIANLRQFRQQGKPRWSEPTA